MTVDEDDGLSGNFIEICGRSGGERCAGILWQNMCEGPVRPDARHFPICSTFEALVVGFEQGAGRPALLFRSSRP